MRFLARLSFFLFLSSFAGPALLAEEELPADGEAAGPRITFHGFLTQAYAQSDGHQFFGISEDGTADYRTAALQIRADLSSADTFVVQLSHERFGASRIQEIKEDIELDWLFYEHRFGYSAVKVGRVQIPFGIYNEVRDVGTLLPFYRPSHNFYGETVYSAETVDGIVLSRSFPLGKAWSLDADVYYGDCAIIERDFTGGYINTPVSDTIGAELWLETPVSGLRVGAGALRFDIASPVLGEQRPSLIHVSVAGEFDRFAIHAEIKEIDLDSVGESVLGYVHLGVNLTGKLTVHAQQDFAYFQAAGAPRNKADDDRILGINYALNPALVLKAEHHWSESGFWLEDLPTFTTERDETRYWIVSLSTSF
jgi:hypothetical protein